MIPTIYDYVMIPPDPLAALVVAATLLLCIFVATEGFD
jgi:hypothetical protein